ncbi:glycosyltransferase [Taibaiella lutea]|uniref:Glycosyltransferase n=1 Tax=Taibaiella lutea TaxID=2608001 RepID=A0A5M6CEV4_9BACT|nr:glycosyltransferase [Taibaiella lutea]KAA5533704.1 glycosyltransferase [Taibaiella lutea]
MKEPYNHVEEFRHRLFQWVEEQVQFADTGKSNLPVVSVEIPVFKGDWLIPCIESVLQQTVNRWVLYLVWDEGDALSHHILQIIHQLNHPRLKAFFKKNQGIARSRHFLSSIATEDYIIPLDDDDVLDAAIVEDLTGEAVLKPWASIIRARRRFIDENGGLVDMQDWFPFEHRKYQQGMVTDIYNHCQPTLLSRKAYKETSGWEGFSDFYYAGEDCDIYLKLEEKGAIELYDKVLYYYRLNSKRTSHSLRPEGAYEMWRRLADKSIARMGLPLTRVNIQPPFIYERKSLPVYTKDMIDFVIPFVETDEKESGDCKNALNRCVDSLKRIGISEDAIHVVNKRNSYSANRNYGYSLTKQPLICFMDSKTEIIQEASIEEMLSLMTSHNADLIGPRMITATNNIFSADPYFNESQWPIPRGVHENDDGRYQYACEVTWLPSAFLIVKSEVMKSINGFDETYESSPIEDADFCIKARARNFKCIYAGTTSVRNHNNERNDCLEENFKRFILRWGSRKELFRQIKSESLSESLL